MGVNGNKLHERAADHLSRRLLRQSSFIGD